MINRTMTLTTQITGSANNGNYSVPFQVSSFNGTFNEANEARMESTVTITLLSTGVNSVFMLAFALISLFLGTFLLRASRVGVNP